MALVSDMSEQTIPDLMVSANTEDFESAVEQSRKTLVELLEEDCSND